MKAVLKSRIKCMERKYTYDLFYKIDFIQPGMCYDELSEEKRELYCNYLNVDRITFEQLQIMVMGTLHVEVERKHKSTTPQQMQQTITEVEKYLLGENK